jgi:hypothetical protein
MTPTKWKGSHNLVEKEKEKRYRHITTVNAEGQTNRYSQKEKMKI